MTVAQWSTTASLNVLSSGTSGTGGTNIDEGMARSDVNNAMRDIMSQIATWRTAATIGGFFSQTVIGHTAALSIGGNADNFEVFGTTAATGGVAIGMFSATPATSGHLDFYKSANASIGSATVVASGEALGAVNWYGAQQTGTFATQTMAAQIRAEADGTVTSGGSGDMPGRIVFATTADSGSAVTDRLILDSSGRLKPNANDGVALGTTALSYADLFLASGAVINYANSDYTLTHSSGTLTASGAFTVSGAFTSLGIDDNATGERVQIADTGINFGPSSTADYSLGRVLDTGSLSIGGSAVAATTAGAILTLWGASHATRAGDFVLTTQGAGGSPGIDYDSSATLLTVGAAGGTIYMPDTVRIGQNTTSTPGSGNNTAGAAITSAGVSYFSVAGTAAGTFNRTADGTILAFCSGGTLQGSVSISGATTSYNALTGSHFAQWLRKPSDDVRPGTILDSCDEACVWLAAKYVNHEGIACHDEKAVPANAKIGDTIQVAYEYADPDTAEAVSFEAKAEIVLLDDTKHVKVILGEERSTSCYGTLFRHDEYDEPEVAAVGTWIVLMAPETRGKVKRGDWIECAGKGMGRPQAEPYRLNSTVCKIISAEIVREWPDGAYALRCSF